MSAIYQDEHYNDKASRSSMPSNKAKMKKIAGLISGKNKKIECNIQDGIIQNIAVTELVNAFEDLDPQTLNAGWFGTFEITLDSDGDMKIQKKRNLK